MIGAQRFHHVQIGGTANPGHVCAEIFCQLDGIRPDASRCAIDDDLLSAFDVAFAEQAQGCGRTDGHSGSFCIRHVVWLDHHHRLLGQTFIFSIAAKIFREGGGENLVTDLEAGYIFANCFHYARKFRAVDRLSGFCDAQRKASGDPYCGRDSKTSHSKIRGGDGGCVDFDQNLIVFRCRSLDLFELKNFRSTVLGCYNCFHFKTPYFLNY